MQKQYEILVAAMRGRLNSSGKWIQHLEILGSDNTNTITSVEKDNLIIEVHNGKEKREYDLY